MPINPYANYKQQSVVTMSSGEQIELLYDEAIKNINLSIHLMGEENYEASEVCTEKTKRIFTYLSTVLDREFEISQNLYQLYSFFNREIIRAEVRRDPTVLEEIIPLIKDMKDTWVKAVKLAHINK